jgi:mono/diheme cytochrome c family protein
MRPTAALVALGAALAGCHGGPAAPSGPTFYKDVEALVQQNCQGCHVAGGIAPFALDSYDAVKAKLDKIVDQVDARTMPPWPPGEAGAPLQHSRALAKADVDLILTWAKNGAPAGNKSDHVDRTPILETVRPDVELKMSEPYTPKPELSDDYRCFVMDPHVTEQTFVAAFDIQPGVAAQVHHVILYLALDQGDTLQRLQATDDADPGPGYGCFGGPMIESSTGGFLPPYRFLGGWAPGAGAVRLSQGTGIALPPHAKIVMQVHYNANNGRKPDQTVAHLELVPTGLKEAILFPLDNEYFSIPPGAKDLPVENTTIVPDSIGAFTIFGLFPHMHLFGTEISLDVTHAGLTYRLIDIPHWSFHWQGTYALQTPLRVVPGDALKLRCVYDNTAANQPWIDGAPQTPKVLRWGEKTTDEMCLVFMYVTL